MSDWLVDAEDGAGMQLARVIVNRLWHHHFGRGIVKTPNDFGELGARPSHPQLLDGLARQLIDNGWKLKPMHRLILTSATYRQTGAPPDAAGLEVDAENIWLWHRRPQRLEAEAIRDHYLSVAGVLKPELFGPAISIGNYRKSEEDRPDHWRRSIYLQVHRAVRHPTLGLFDVPNSERSVGARSTSAAPDGALFALNAPLTWTLAEHFAQRLTAEAGSEPDRLIEQAWLLALARKPDPEERKIGLDWLSSGGDRALVEYAHIVMGLNEFIYVH
ncbi:MAG: DUF1553 domain-containing protein [Verrucomicrobiota bacterium]